MHMVLFCFVLLYLSLSLQLLISMLWHRQTIFESKGDTLSSSAECRIRTLGLKYQIASSLSARGQTDWAIEDQAKNPSARPYGQRAFSPLDPTASWLSHLALAKTCLWLISILWHRQTLFKSKGDKLSSSAEALHPIEYAYGFILFCFVVVKITVHWWFMCSPVVYIV